MGTFWIKFPFRNVLLERYRNYREGKYFYRHVLYWKLIKQKRMQVIKYTYSDFLTPARIA